MWGETGQGPALHQDGGGRKRPASGGKSKVEV